MVNRLWIAKYPKISTETSYLSKLLLKLYFWLNGLNLHCQHYSFFHEKSWAIKFELYNFQMCHANLEETELTTAWPRPLNISNINNIQIIFNSVWLWLYTNYRGLKKGTNDKDPQFFFVLLVCSLSRNHMIFFLNLTLFLKQ